MKLTPQIARELNKKGAKISYSQIVKDAPKEKISVPSVQTKEPEKNDDVIIKELVNLVGVNIKNTNEIIKVVAEMNKPKPKKKYECIVGRDIKGKISVVDIEEK